MCLGSGWCGTAQYGIQIWVNWTGSLDQCSTLYTFILCHISGQICVVGGSSPNGRTFSGSVFYSNTCIQDKWKYVCMHTYIHTYHTIPYHTIPCHTYIYTYIHNYTRVCIYVYIYIYIYIDTYIICVNQLPFVYSTQLWKVTMFKRYMSL